MKIVHVYRSEPNDTTKKLVEMVSGSSSISFIIKSSDSRVGDSFSLPSVLQWLSVVFYNIKRRLTRSIDGWP